MDFDSSAKAMGEMSAVFGIQMDAMEMTYLANEDQEEFLNRMREDVLAAGHDVDNMSQARQKLLADQLNMNVKQMRTFMREGELGISQEDLLGATDKADGLDAMQTAYDSFADSTVGATRTAAEAMDAQMDAAAASAVRSLTKLEVQAGLSMTAVQNIKFTEKNIASFDKMLKAYEVTAGKLTIEASELTAGLISSSADLGATAINTISSAVEEVSAALESAYNYFGGSGEVNVVTSGAVDVINSYDTGELANSIINANDPLTSQIGANTAANEELSKAVSGLTSTLAANKGGEIKLMLDKEVFGKGVLNALETTTTPSGRQAVMTGGA